MSRMNEECAPAIRGQNPLCAQDASFQYDGKHYSIACYTSLDQIQSLKGPWVALENRSDNDLIYFQSYDWCYTWCKTHTQIEGTGSAENSKIDIRIFAVFCEGELVQLWPLMLNRSRFKLSRLQCLTLPHGQYGNILVNRDHCDIRCGKIVWQHIRKMAKCDVVNFDQFPADGYLAQILGNNGCVENSNKYASILELSQYENWESFQSTLSRNQRKQRRQIQTRLSKLGNLSYDVILGNDPQYAGLVKHALHMKNVWLKNTGRNMDVISHPHTGIFLQQLSGAEQEPNKNPQPPQGAILGVLKLDDQAIAIEIGACLGRHYYSYLGAFDWRYRNYSPGKIQIQEAQKWAMSVGIEYFDFLGDPADYKSSWTDRQFKLQSRSIPLSTVGYFYSKIWKSNLRPMGKSMFHKFSVSTRSKLLMLMGYQKNIPQDS